MLSASWLATLILLDHQRFDSIVAVTVTVFQALVLFLRNEIQGIAFSKYINCHHVILPTSGVTSCKSDSEIQEDSQDRLIEFSP